MRKRTEVVVSDLVFYLGVYLCLVIASDQGIFVWLDLPNIFGGGSCGSGRRRDKILSIRGNLPRRFESIFRPIVCCNEGAFVLTGLRRDGGAEGSLDDGRGGSSVEGKWTV